MGQCQTQSIVQSEIDIVPLTKKTQTKSQFHTSTKVVEELRHFPPIPKIIDDVMRELGSFSHSEVPEQVEEIDENEREYRKFVIKVSQRKGIFRMRDKSIFEGTIEENKFKGPGKLLMHGSVYILSTFRDSKPCYNTRIIKNTGEYFDGYISPSEQQGPSRGQIFERGVRYNGQIRERKPHGFGEQISDTHYFKGQYENGQKKNGVFKLFTEKRRKSFKLNSGGMNESKMFRKTLSEIATEEFNPKKEEYYEGQLLRGLYHGYGTLKDKTGKYEGNFLNGKKEGYGKLFLWDGTQFRGTFKNDRLVNNQTTHHEEDDL